MIQPQNMQAQYPQQGGANAVAINIYNPQAYGGAVPAANANTQAPYQYTNSLYQMPEASAYPTMQPMNQAMMYPQQYTPMMTQPIAPQFVAPAPQAMPTSVLTDAPQVTNNQTIEAQPQAAEAPAQAAPVEIVEQPAQAQTVNVDELVQNLKSTDANTKAATINQLASYAQDAPEIALQIVSEPVMQGLVDIINEDTTTLEGPTPEQIAISEKIAKGEQLTPEEDALAEQLSPRDMANKNRIFALYTLAMIQKLQRDELNQYIEAQKANGQETIAPLNAQDLIGYNDVVNVIKNDSRPEVKVAAIQALQHIVEPQDKAAVEPVLTEAQNSQDNEVKAAATEALTKFATA